MYNGISGTKYNYKDELRYGVSSDGYGDLDSAGVPPIAPTSAGHKVKESYFDDMEFLQVLAVGSDGSWFILENTDSATPITAAEAFQVSGYYKSYRIVDARGANGAPSPATTPFTTVAGERFHGPFIHDAFGTSYTWMWADWADGGGTAYQGKGKVVNLDSNPPPNAYTWSWYGLVTSHTNPLIHSSTFVESQIITNYDIFGAPPLPWFLLCVSACVSLYVPRLSMAMAKITTPTYNCNRDVCAL
jgi:hypothetical protein